METTLQIKLKQLLHERISLDQALMTRLPKSILQEAIQGRLVPQDDNDEPASALLERIQEKKQKLLKEGKIKKKDIVDSVIFKGEDNKYYEKIDGKVLDINDEIPYDMITSITRRLMAKYWTSMTRYRMISPHHGHGCVFSRYAHIFTAGSHRNTPR